MITRLYVQLLCDITISIAQHMKHLQHRIFHVEELTKNTRALQHFPFGTGSGRPWQAFRREPFGDGPPWEESSRIQKCLSNVRVICLYISV